MGRREHLSVQSLATQVVLCVIAVIWFWPFATSSLMEAQDEGVEATAALQILEGRTLYTGIVQSVKLPVYLLAGLFALFGVKLVVARLAELVVCTLLVLAVYRFTSRRTGVALAIAAAACVAAWSLPFWNIVGWDWEGVLLTVVAAALFERHLNEGGLPPLAGAGATCGALFFLQSDMALLTGAGFAAIITVRHLVEGRGAGETTGRLAHCGAALAAGFLAVLALVAVVAAAGGFLREMVWQMVVGPLTTYGFVDRLFIPFPVPPYGPPGEAWWYGGSFETWRIYLVPLVVFPAALSLLARSLRRGDPRRWDDLLVFVLGTAVFMQVFPRSDLQHYVFALVGLFILLAWTLHRMGEIAAPWTQGRARRAALAVALVAPMACIAADGAAKAAATLKVAMVRSSFPALAGIRIPVDREDELRGVAGFLQSRGVARGDEVLVLPADPVLYLILGLKNPVRYNCIDQGFHDATDEHEVIDALERKGGRWIIFRGWDRGGGFDDYAPVLHGYLTREYRPAAAFGHFAVLSRRDDGGAR